MIRLWCAGRLGNCPDDVKRFRFTCLYCRWRRRLNGSYKTPPYYIRYTYRSLGEVFTRRKFIIDGKIYTRSDGGYLTFVNWRTLNIDPRSRAFRAWRCATIIVFDRLMLKSKWLYKPLAEFCEFLANYP